jgi:L-ascorbate metabolism protein UlaG (beta-lactamase superfamily)
MKCLPSLRSLSGGISAIALMCALPGSAGAGEGDPVRLTWIGGATLVIRFGPIAIVTDPVLGEGEQAFRMFDPNTGQPDAAHRRLVSVPPASFEEIDLVLVSHDHADHLDEIALDRLSHRPFLVPAGQSERLRARGVTRVDGIGWNQAREIFEEGYRLRIEAVPARHSADPETSSILGPVNGYRLEFAYGSYRRAIYWTGDTFPDPKDLEAMPREPDLLVPHLGGVGAGGPFGKVSMGAAEAVDLANFLQPGTVLPIHHSTFSHYREPVEAMERLSPGRGWTLRILREGEEMELE